MVRWRIEWRTKDMRAIRRIRERFNMPQKMSVNMRTPIDIEPEGEDYELLLDIERRGWLRIERVYMKDLL